MLDSDKIFEYSKNYWIAEIKKLPLGNEPFFEPQVGLDFLARLIGNPVVETYTGHYGGDYLALIALNLQTNAKAWVFVTFGYGSCSGCDRIFGCRTYEELMQAAREFCNSSKWFETHEEAEEYFNTKDWETEWYSGYGERAKPFIEACKTYLRVYRETDHKPALER